ncbi:MAG: FG-GAP repeat domain-containing protein [Planctomycetota bacterium]
MARARLLLPSLVLGALLGGVLHADQERLALRVWTFRLPGTELACEAVDMDGDGDRDIVVAHMKDASGGEARAVSVFLQGPRNQRFAAEPERRYDVPPDACAFVAGDLDPAPGGELVFLCPGRLVLVTADGKARDLVSSPGFFDYPESGGLPTWDLARDLDGDGVLELIVPQKTGYTILRRTKDSSLAPSSEVTVPLVQGFGPAFETKLLNRFLSATLRLRRVVHSDLDGDGRQDLIAYRDKGLSRFLQRKDGTFPQKPDREDELELVTGSERSGKKGEGGEAFANVRLNLADLNGDGLADLLATKTVGELGVFETLRTQQLVFLGRKDLPQTWNERKPDALINLKGISDDPILVDWDGDGRKDLVLGSYRMDMWTNVKRAILKTLTITYVIFIQRKDGAPFGDEPDVSLDVEVPLESLSTRGGHRACIFHADLDGDGIHDQVSRRPDGGLQVARGRVVERAFGGAERGFSDEPQRLSLPPTEPPWVVDLDGDGADELVLEPFGGDDAAARTLRVVGVAR